MDTVYTAAAAFHSDRLFFDIETIPDQRDGALGAHVAAVTAPAQYKKAESIAEWLDANRAAEGERQWLKTSFDGGAGQVCVIAWAVEDGVPQSLAVADPSPEEEARVLREFFAAVSESRCQVFVGHNLIGFDLPFIWKRAMVLGVKPPFTFPRQPKAWSELVHDTMLLWDNRREERASMDTLCAVFGLPGKGDVDGSKVWPMVAEGRIDEVAEYCRGDVERTRALFKRMTFEA